jgi:PDZ domain-containing protein
VTRSTATTISSVAVVLLGILIGVVHVPYSVLGPGPVCNTVGPPRSVCPAIGNATSFISVPAAYDHPTTSELGFTTVSEQDGEPSAADALFEWLSASHAIVPRELLHPPSVSDATTRQQDVQQMVGAQDSAVITAEDALGLVNAQVQSVLDHSPADGVLQPGDLVLAVNGTSVADAAALQRAVSAGSSATPYVLQISRGGKRLTVALHRALVDGHLVLGIELTNAPRVPVTLTLDPNSIGGPSAGLMFALGVYDRLTPGNLAGSTVVAGTGEIDAPDPTVKPIGGIAQKMYAARHSFHATLFLAPQGNCGDVRGHIPKGLQVVPVTSFAGALSVLAAARNGTLASEPHC